MLDMNNSNDVIEMMRDGEMTDEQIIKVCEEVALELRIRNGIVNKELT